MTSKVRAIDQTIIDELGYNPLDYIDLKDPEYRKRGRGKQADPAIVTYSSRYCDIAYALPATWLAVKANSGENGSGINLRPGFATSIANHIHRIDPTIHVRAQDSRETEEYRKRDGTRGARPVSRRLYVKHDPDNPRIPRS